jgi:hypothetical protein
MQINECSTLIFKGTLHYFVAFLRYNISIMVLNGALGSDKKISTKGFGLVETLVGVAVFVAVSVAAYGGFINTLEGVKVLRAKNTATNLANEQIEIIRNLPYDDVGIVDGIPVGKIPRDQIIERDNITFEVNTSVRNVDDPFDGQIGETPNDLSPADYKLVQLEISCQNCLLEEPFQYYARVSPYALETTGDNGALFVQVLDSNGQPLSGANVNIFNDTGTSTINIDEVTDNSGMFQLIDAPPGVEVYEIIVTGDDLSGDYSVDQTYQGGLPANPNPHKRHSSVFSGQVTQASFVIDELSDLDVRTIQSDCSPVSNVGFELSGNKTIGTDDQGEGILKYVESLVSNASGYLGLSGLEWDNYSVEITESGYYLSGSNPSLPLELNAGSDQNLDLVLQSANPNAVLIKVIDGETDLPISGATVLLEGIGGGASGEYELLTGFGFLNQTDWSGGSGQELIGSDNEYYDSVDVDVSANGQITLNEFAGIYNSSGWLESSTFDVGTTTNFSNLFWEPVDQPSQSGENSARLQIASNLELTATSTWDFVGPDGTGATFYESPGEEISDDHDGNRYLRYKVYLTTEDTSFTPIVSDVSFTYVTDCIPPGQVFFDGLDLGAYNLNISHSEYSEYDNSSFEISESWSDFEVQLSP